MILPLLLIFVAGFSAAVVAYGTYPSWIQFPHGLEIILWSRRLQWPLVSLSLLACILLMALAISGRRRAWWLIGLAPVLALFMHRFAPDSSSLRMSVVENPHFISADSSRVPDDEWVVGLSFGDGNYAYPYSSLFTTPVIIQADHDKRMILMWSAFANRVLALPIDADFKGRNLDIVSTPANALLLYDSRRGQFINAFTGQTMKHEKPAGFGSGLPIPTSKMPWRQWRDLHPDTQVLASTGIKNPHAPTAPVLPIWPLPPGLLDQPPETRVALVGASQPIAFDPNQITAGPLNSKADGVPVTLFRGI